MSHTHVIDNEEPQLFHFDSCDESDLLHIPTLIPTPARTNSDPLEPISHMPSHDAAFTSEEIDLEADVEVAGKGKGVTRSLSIRVPVATSHRVFDVAYSASDSPSTSRGSRDSFNLLTPLTASDFDKYSFYDNPQQQLTSSIIMEDARNTSLQSFGNSKGKHKESPPVLPTLAFSPTEFVYSPLASPFHLSSSGPSSYTSSILPLTRVTSNPESPPPISPISDAFQHPSHQMIYRPRSLSNISIQSKRSLSARSLRSRLALQRSSTHLARKLLSKKATDLKAYPSNIMVIQSIGEPPYPAHSNPKLWCTGLKVDELDATISQFSDLHLQDVDSKSTHLFYHSPRLKHKGRTQSSPFPLSALDLVPLSSSDTFVPIPLVIRNYFDEVLPRELRLHVFEALVGLHEADYMRALRESRWSVSKASSPKNRWVGRDRGVRELVKLSRVSKSWQALVFDGQLWVGLDLRSFPDMVETLVLRFTSTGGQCIRSLDVSGNSHISAATLLDMADHFCINFSSDLDSLCYTQLTVVNLQGCSALTTRSLHHLLFRSRSLQKLCVKGLKAVTNTTCGILSTYNTQLIYLDVSRCINMDAEGVEGMASAALDRGDHLLLKELRMSGLKNIDDDMMVTLGQATPFLEVLDLSYARQLHNSAVDAFVACDMEMESVLAQETILVSPRDLGRDSNDLRIRRRVTRLRHLSLSYCLLLTDNACASLTSSVPHLEFLEFGGIGADIKDGGLVRLLNTTPYIRRLDLEDASHITDAVLLALTPGIRSSQPPLPDVMPEPGHALEQLNISFAVNITNDALLGLIRGCTSLKHIEADNTHINSAVLKEFVRRSHRQGTINAKANVVDCRGVSESTVKDLAGFTRPRKGWRAYEARDLMFLDTRDGNTDELKAGQDECDEKRVVLKSFYSWQTVDNVRSARKKRPKSKRRASESGDSETDEDSGRALRWWSPGGRIIPRTSGRNSPLNIADLNSDGCTLM